MPCYYSFIKDFILVTISSIITAAGVLIIAMGTIVATYEFFSVIIQKGLRGRVFNEVRLDYAHYLILGLDFFIAKYLIDIIINPLLNTLLLLFLIIIVKTMLNYFLHKDIVNIRHTKHFHK
jgi:uncharacterized membrane protein